MVPNIITFCLLQDPKSNVVYLIYLFSFMPTVPTTVLLLKIVAPDFSYIPYNIFSKFSLPYSPIFDASLISSEAMWSFIIFDIALWFFIYSYLDSVVLNQFGVQKHPCFCCKKKVADVN